MIKIDHKTVIAGVGAVVVLYWLAKNEVKKIAQSVNPVNPDNAINEAATAVWQNITGDPHASIGGSIYDAVHHADGTLKWPWDKRKIWGSETEKSRPEAGAQINKSAVAERGASGST